MKPVSSFHTGQEIGARGEGCDETTTQTTRASHPHHLFGISIIFQRLLLYFPGLLQRSLAEGGLQTLPARREEARSVQFASERHSIRTKEIPVWHGGSEFYMWNMSGRWFSIF